MSELQDNIAFAERRLNSLMNEIMEGTKGVGDTQSHNVEFYSTKRFLELHKQIAEMFPLNKRIPKYLTIEEIPKKYQYGRGYYVKSTIRELADALGIKLEYDKKSESSPFMAQYQSQNVSQVNLQTLSSVIDCVNNLQMDWNTKEKVVELLKEFEQEATTEKNPSKLKSILTKVAEISPTVAGFLFQHAHELGLTKLLFGT